jgi:aldehyde:ferredoxin oxidoreductase
MGNILRVDLTHGDIRVENLPEEPILRKLIGGEALGTYLLFHELPLKAQALAPESAVVILTGPLTGTGFTPGGAKATAAFLSPMTGYTLGLANSAGFWAVGLKAAGYDGLILTGVSAQPVYLYITEREVSLRDASRVWGKGTRNTEDLLRQEVGLRDARVACIGPAGENLARGAMVANDYGHNFAHGLGAIFGSKKLKAIVVHGSLRPPIHDRTRLIAAGDRWRGLVRQRNPAIRRGVGHGGTWGALNKKNWRSSIIEPEDNRGFETNRITMRPCFQDAGRLL